MLGNLGVAPLRTFDTPSSLARFQAPTSFGTIHFELMGFVSFEVSHLCMFVNNPESGLANLRNSPVKMIGIYAYIVDQW